MSLRATGEGHVSSIVFRTGVVDAAGGVSFEHSSQYVAKMRVDPDKRFDKHLFFLKLIEMGAYADAARIVLGELPDPFTYDQLDAKAHEVKHRPGSPRPFDEAANNMRWLARSNYTLRIPEDAEPDEIVVFPTSENESRGIEDARLTRFTDDDGTVTYYGTYTAYNGFKILPQMFETQDFKTISVHTLNGKHVQNKGMALFPRKIDGFYRMVSRLDGENMFMMKSDNPYFWNEAQKLCEPVYPWEFVQVGNCGPPIETEHGWLLLTHGVGPVRQYCIGAMLLDLDDPTKVLGHLEQPLLVPQEDERNGYVPNVVYTCGALAHGDTLVMPYAVSDSATTVATLSLSQLLDHLTSKA
ncbi:MAG: glycoside hydrolase family 130 protein [Planctomycetota bacterium]